MPLVFDAMIEPPRRCCSTRSNSFRLISRFSTTASITRSQSLSFARSSSKFPILTSEAISGVKNAAGLAFLAASSPVRAVRLRTSFDSSVRPFICSSGVSSRGAISSRSVGTLALASCAAICAPMVPAPSTAAFSIRVISYLQPLLPPMAGAILFHHHTE